MNTIIANAVIRPGQKRQLLKMRELAESTTYSKLKDLIGVGILADGIIYGTDIILETLPAKNYLKNCSLSWMGSGPRPKLDGVMSSAKYKPVHADIVDYISKVCGIRISDIDMSRIWLPRPDGSIFSVTAIQILGKLYIVDGPSVRKFGKSVNGVNVLEGAIFTGPNDVSADIVIAALWSLFSGALTTKKGLPTHTYVIPHKGFTKTYKRGVKGNSWVKPHIRRAHWRRINDKKVVKVPMAVVGGGPKGSTTTIVDMLRKARSKDQVPVIFR